MKTIFALGESPLQRAAPWGGRRVRLLYHLGDPPPGQVVDLQDTTQLMLGDMIYIEFPAFSGGFFKYGGSTVLTVTGIDPSSGQITMTDPGGQPYTFPPGTKDQWMAKLNELTSFSLVEVIRPSGAAPAPPPPPPAPVQAPAPSTTDQGGGASGSWGPPETPLAPGAPAPSQGPASPGAPAPGAPSGPGAPTGGVPWGTFAAVGVLGAVILLFALE